MKFLSRFAPLIFFTAVVLLFFKPFWFEGKLPVPADTIVGLYHPWRDFYSPQYPSGIPFKNFLITDPVRQQFVWRSLGIEIFKKGQWPLWNPYNFSGTPLLANFQSALFYPLNLLFFILPFSLAWSILVTSEPLLGGIFLYIYLRNLKLKRSASLVGAVSFSFSGFSVAWLEWNTIIHTVLWLPLILLSIDKIMTDKASKKWIFLLIFSLVSSFFAGHLQIFFYVFIFSLSYLLVRWWQQGKLRRTILLFTACYLMFAILTAVQWWPTLKFISLSARSFDLPAWQNPGWFLPFQNLVQFLAPDFFGNPATLNYFGIWNYGEFVGYLGILSLILAFLAVFWRRDKKTLFFALSGFIALLLALPTPLAKLPYQLQIPLISTGQPTRLIFLIDFCLSILAALGLDWVMRNYGESNYFKKTLKVLGLFFMIFLALWFFVFLNLSGENTDISKRNLILPTIFFSISAVLLLLLKVGNEKLRKITLILSLMLVIFDLFRFGWKFTPFTDEKWLFPKTSAIEFLQSQTKPFRFMTTDRKIFPPNFSTFYHLEDAAGYDPLYLQSYGEFIGNWDGKKAGETPPSFNRILTPQDYSSRFTDLLGVKYVLSLKEENSPKLKLVFKEGETRIYENIEAFPRAFFVGRVGPVTTKAQAGEGLFMSDLSKDAIVQIQGVFPAKELGVGEVQVKNYNENEIILKTNNQKEGFLVLTNIYYPSWEAKIDGQVTEIYQTDYTFQGIIVPAGEHEVVFKISF